MPDYSYLGSGKVYLREIGATTGFLEVGNASALSFSVAEDTKTLQDYTQPGGGTYNEVKRITAVECSISMHDLSPENLSRAVYGGTSSVASTPVTGEAKVIYPNSFAPFAKLPSTSVTPTVTTAGGSATPRANTAAVTVGAYIKPVTDNGFYYKVTTAGTTAATIPTFPTVVGETVTDGTAVFTCAGKLAVVANTDYEVRPGGIFVYKGATLAGETWTVGYTAVAADLVQALISSGKEYEIIFDGLNEARSGKRTRVNAYRVKLGATKDLSLIGDDYAVIESTGKLLKDTTKTGAGVSQYFRVDIEQ